MVVNVSLISQEGLGLERQLHRLDALLVLFVVKEDDALLVEHHRVVLVDFACGLEVIDRILVLFHVEVAACTISKELNIFGPGSDGFVEVDYCFLIVFLLMIATAEPIIDGGIIAGVGTLKTFDCGFSVS